MSYDPSVEVDPDLDPDPAGDGVVDPSGDGVDPVNDVDPDGCTEVAPQVDPNAAGPAPCAYTEYDYAAIPDAADLPATGEGSEGLEADVWDALYSVDDPEMPVSVVDLGLIYNVEVEESSNGAGASVTVDMTLTYSGCPAREMLTGEVEEAVRAVEGVEDVTLRLVWSPEWSLEMVTDRGKERLREFGLAVE